MLYWIAFKFLEVRQSDRYNEPLIEDVRGSCLPDDVEMAARRRTQSSRVDAAAVREGRPVAETRGDKVVRRGMEKSGLQLNLRILGGQRAVFANGGPVVVAEHFGQVDIEYDLQENVRGIHGRFGKVAPVRSSKCHIDVLERSLDSEVVLRICELIKSVEMT